MCDQMNTAFTIIGYFLLIGIFGFIGVFAFWKAFEDGDGLSLSSPDSEPAPHKREKPRIRQFCSSPLFVQWSCAGWGYTALGATPEDAYRKWIGGFQNSSIGSSYAKPLDEWMLWNHQ